MLRLYGVTEQTFQGLLQYRQVSLDLVVRDLGPVFIPLYLLILKEGVKHVLARGGKGEHRGSPLHRFRLWIELRVVQGYNVYIKRLGDAYEIQGYYKGKQRGIRYQRPRSSRLLVAGKNRERSPGKY